MKMRNTYKIICAKWNKQTQQYDIEQAMYSDEITKLEWDTNKKHYQIKNGIYEYSLLDTSNEYNIKQVDVFHSNQEFIF